MATSLQEIVPVDAESTYADFPLYRISMEQYDRMIAAGIIGGDERCFLLDGVLVAKMTKEPPHVVATNLTVKALERIVPEGWHVRKEDPVDLPDGPHGFGSVPEPDLSIIRGAIRDYSSRTPGPDDAALVVEVADSSLRADRKKISRYAWVQIPMAWIINLDTRQVEVYSQPSGPAEEPGYRELQTFAENDAIRLILDGNEVGRVAVRDLLP